MKKGIYILPNLFTTGNLFCGMLSVLYSTINEYSIASWFILGAMFFDILDGRIARWTKTVSDFGIEYDSMADLISFGVAPAILMYQIVLNIRGNVGVAIALFYVMAVAMRLARYNVRAKEGLYCSDFMGLPSPAAAGVLASFVLSYELFLSEPGSSTITVKTIPLIMQRMPLFFHAIPIVMVIISFLMLSQVRYKAFKGFKLAHPKNIKFLVFIVSGLLLIIAFPQNTIFIIFTLYLLSGLMGYIVRYIRLRRLAHSDFNQKNV